MPKTKSAQLIMAANSLGQICDIPSRSLDALRSSDLLIFEEDRPARQALKAAAIHRDYLKLSEHQEVDTLSAAEEALRSGKTVCYMSDQGMPTLADPGRALLDMAYRLKVSIQVIPGPSSISSALAACPFPVDTFYYQGFLPREKGERIAAIQNLRDEHREPIVILEAPYRRKQLLGALAEVFPENTKALLAVDISGPGENYHYDRLKALVQMEMPKLNFVIILNPAKS